MAKNGTFYLARVIKVGYADAENISRVILNPEIITFGKTKWTIIDGESLKSRDEISFCYGKLVKFHPKSDLSIVNTDEKTEESISESNLIAAKSPFIYIPSQSGIVFLNVPNHIERNKFFKTFERIYTDTLNQLLNAIELHTINDLRQFYEKIKSLDKIMSIQSKVFPPNPLFGILWKNLRNYLETRNASSLNLNEQGKDVGINSDLPIMVEAIVEKQIDTLISKGFVPSLTDAAIIMATDGYGYGTIIGLEDGKIVPIHTYETTRSFKMPPNVDPQDLFNIAYPIFKKIESDHRMEHPDEQE